MTNKKKVMKKWAKISFIISIIAVGSVFYFMLNFNNFSTENFAFAQSSSITIITLTNNNVLLGGAEYSITPNPLGSSGTFTIKDNSISDSEKDKDGIITISGVKNGNYTISQITTSNGYDVDMLSKTIQVKDSSAVSTFTNILSGTSFQSSNSIKNITYTAKFECGSISADEGPLRPGHYDTDLSIFNKQNY